MLLTLDLSTKLIDNHYTSGSNSAVECLPSKQGVAGSNPVSRSKSPVCPCIQFCTGNALRSKGLSLLAAWFRLVVVAVFAINMLNRLNAFQLIESDLPHLRWAWCFG
jgi:hypothetical protein